MFGLKPWTTGLGPAALALVSVLHLGCASLDYPTVDGAEDELGLDVAQESQLALCDRIDFCGLQEDVPFNCVIATVSGAAACKLAKANLWDCLSEQSCDGLLNDTFADLCPDESDVVSDECIIVVDPVIDLEFPEVFSPVLVP